MAYDPISGLNNAGLGGALDFSGRTFYSDGSSAGLSAYAPTSTNWGNIAGAGIGAAGNTVGTIAQIMSQTAARQAAVDQANAGRAGSLQIAKMQILANAAAQQKQREWAAQQLLANAYNSSSKNALNSYDTQRDNNARGSSFLTAAFTS
jgi:hypothetical protein